MANIKISELNELTKNQRAYNDYVPIVDSSADETKKISLQNIMQSNIQLLAVTDTAPSECNVGDKYYNTETNRIYTATATDTWGTTGEEPISDILYIVLEERTSYTYDGETLVSVGGGSGSEIVVGEEEPTEDTKLMIESNDLDGNYEVNTETYSTSETLTNKVWIDGKPIWRKVVQVSNITIDGTTQIDTGITNLDSLVSIKGMFFNNGAKQPYPLIYINNNVLEETGIAFTGGNKIVFATNTSWGSSPLRTHTFIIEYTKGGN